MAEREIRDLVCGICGLVFALFILIFSIVEATSMFVIYGVIGLIIGIICILGYQKGESIPSPKKVAKSKGVTKSKRHTKTMAPISPIDHLHSLVSGLEFPRVRVSIDLFCWNCGSLVRAGKVCRNCKGKVRFEPPDIQEISA